MTFKRHVHTIREYHHLLNEDTWASLRRHHAQHPDHTLQSHLSEFSEFNIMDFGAYLDIACGTCQLILFSRQVSAFVLSTFRESGHG